jgi:hypothetical protein
LLGLPAFTSKVPHLPTLEAWKVVGGKLLWRPDGSLLWQWSRSTVELLLLLLLLLLLWLLLLELSLLVLWVIAPIMLLLRSRWGIHHEVLRRSTTRATTGRGSRHHPLPLLLIGLSNGLHQPFLINGCTCQFVIRQGGELSQALLQVDGKSFTVQVSLLLNRIDMI